MSGGAVFIDVVVYVFLAANLDLSIKGCLLVSHINWFVPL